VLFKIQKNRESWVMAKNKPGYRLPDELWARLEPLLPAPHGGQTTETSTMLIIASR